MFKGKVIAGLKILAHMRNAGEKVVMADVAEEVDISCSYADQLFSVLRKAGLVKGIRGPGGGYVLAKTEKELAWFEVWELIDFAELFYPGDDNDVISCRLSGMTLDEVLVGE